MIHLDTSFLVDLLAHLRSGGNLVSTMDLLIATAAVLDAAPILTANVAHFERIPELEVLGYWRRQAAPARRLLRWNP